jgi:hypothetical protein
MKGMVKYCCDHDDQKAYENYYQNQCGHGMPVFYGARMQRGHGLGSIFSGLFRTVFPILKRIAPIIGRKALQTGVQIAGDVASGQSFKNAAKTRVVDVINEGINKIIPTQEAQSGSGIRRKRRYHRHRISKKNKRRKLDIFS